MFILLMLVGIGFVRTLDVAAQGIPPYHINHWTYDASAGGVSKGTTYAVRGTLGQHGVYSSSNASTVSSGIWEGRKHLSPQAPEILILEKEYRDLEAPVESGDNLGFIVAVTNNGDDPQTNVIITDTIPTGLALVPGSAEIDSSKGNIEAVYSDTIVVRTEQLSYEQIAVLTYRAIVDAERGETITSTVTARSDTYGPIIDHTSFSVRGPNVVYLPLVMRDYTSMTEPVIEDLADAPDLVPGHRVKVGNVLYQDDFDDENDNDWYVFQAEEGQTYTIETSLIGMEADTIAAIYDTDGTTKLAENDDADWPVNVASRIVWTAPGDGNYHVLVRSYDWRVYGDGTEYRLQIRRGGSADSMEAASGSQSSKPVVPPTPHPGE
jgi:uncharacterized repeat protein (TIGR01451 family)